MQFKPVSRYLLKHELEIVFDLSKMGWKMEPDLSLNWISSLFSKYRNVLFNPYFIPRLIQNETIQRNNSKVFQSVWITG